MKMSQNRPEMAQKMRAGDKFKFLSLRFTFLLKETESDREETIGMYKEC